MAVICGVASFLASASMTPTICEYGDRVSADWRTFQTAFMTCHAAAPIVKAWSFNTIYRTVSRLIDHFGAERMVDDYIRVYEKVLGCSVGAMDLRSAATPATD